MSDKDYPLIEVIRIKRRRLDEAEKVLKEKKAILEKELEKQRLLQQELDKAKELFDTYLHKLREAMDAGEKTHKIDQHKIHLKGLKEKFLIAQKKLEDQKKVVKIAEKNVDEARLEYQAKEKDVEKLKIHKSEWEKALALEGVRQEEIKMDEISTSAYARKKKEG